MGLFSFLRKPKKKPIQAKGQFKVDFDDERISIQHPNTKVQSLAWSDLKLVIIRTTDQGPAVDDIFWILVGEKEVCLVPSESVGAKEFFHRLLQLPGFDYEASIKANCCTENKEFLCWKYKAG